MNIHDFIAKKIQQQKISMMTCYDYTSARIIAETNIDCVLVGDSAAMTMHGHPDTIAATLDMMVWHTSAVKRGAPNKFIISDMPFLSYRKSLSKNVSAAQVLMQAGANAIKLEAASGNIKLIRHLVDSGIPVMGHLGLTPQSIHSLGGFKIQGKTQAAADQIQKDALSLQNAGCFALVLECIPASLAAQISKELSIITIGIGAGAHTDGQVLVLQDLMGLNPAFKPKFVRQFANGYEVYKTAINNYASAVQKGEFPSEENIIK